MKHPEDMSDTERLYWEYQEQGRQEARTLVHDPDLPDIIRQSARDHLARGLEA